ncbi:hypothetical protein EBR03_00230 [bacterium]|nr:hypothetical protein [bacterium]
MVRAFSLIIAVSWMISGPLAKAADLDLEPVTLFKCWRALKKLNTAATPTVPQELTKKTHQQELKVPTYTYLRTAQLQKLFDLSAEGSQGLAKGLSYRTVDGSLTTLFWPAKAKVESSITERDTIEQILKSELRAIENYLAKPRSEKLQLLLDTKENLTYLLQELKKSPGIPENIAERFFGFHLNLKRTSSGAVTIESVDFNPALNGKSAIGSTFGWMEEFQAAVDNISHAIASKHRTALFRIDTTVFNTLYGPLKLKAPPGSQIIEYPLK